MKNFVFAVMGIFLMVGIFGCDQDRSEEEEVDLMIRLERIDEGAIRLRDSISSLGGLHQRNQGPDVFMVKAFRDAYQEIGDFREILDQMRGKIERGEGKEAGKEDLMSGLGRLIEEVEFLVNRSKEELNGAGTGYVKNVTAALKRVKRLCVAYPDDSSAEEGIIK